jgi:hypothetical protein
MTVSGNKTINGMVASLTAATGSPSRFILTGSGSPTITLGGSAARFLISATANGQGVAFSGVNLGASTTTLLHTILLRYAYSIQNIDLCALLYV